MGDLQINQIDAASRSDSQFPDQDPFALGVQRTHPGHRQVQVAVEPGGPAVERPKKDGQVDGWIGLAELLDAVQRR